MKQKYTSVHRYVLGRIWQHERSLFLYGILRIPFDVTDSLFKVFLTAGIASAVLSADPAQLCRLLAWFTVLVFAAKTAGHVLDRKLADGNYRLRMYFTAQYSRAYMMTSYEKIESPEGKDLAKRAKDTLFGFDYRQKPMIEAYISHMIGIAGQLLGVVAYGGLISLLNPLILGMLLVTALITWLFQRFMVRYDQNDRILCAPMERKMNYLIREAKNFGAAKDVKLYGLGDWFGRIFDRQIGMRILRLNRRGKIWLTFQAAVALLNMAFTGVIYAYLIRLYLREGLTIPEFLLYFGLISGFNGWLMRLIEGIEELQRFRFQAEDLRAILELEGAERISENKCEGATEPILESAQKKNTERYLKGSEGVAKEKVSLVFENVTYAYAGGEKPVLDRFNLEIKKGESVAIVGVNGAGKTTLIKLLCGLYTPSAGRILMNGMDIAEMDREELFARLSVVFQDIYVLPASIERNIALESKPDRVKLERVLKQSGLMEKVEALPQKEQTILVKSVREEAIELSGGELQKLALARALYKGGSVLILDEPTAALDPVAESELYQRYHELAGDKTSLFISHRLSSTRFCDRILFLENGKIAECGTHEELMTLGGKYAQMYQVQSRYYQSGEVEI